MALDAVVALVLYGHLFPVRLIDSLGGCGWSYFMSTLVSSDTDCCCCTGCPCYMWTQITSVTYSRWSSGCPSYMLTLISRETDCHCCSVCPLYMCTLISSETFSCWPVVSLVICGHRYPVRWIAVDAGVAFVIYGHICPVRLIAFELWLPLLYVDRVLQCDW